ncbi:helix-turn-helix domain-containing protein [Xanthocytophaga agilis]|uniref:Helix-turn-helix domain-containing protein n=1 Tax=Xanthocytophaga agilis TaxID=3048010 RepID=A0AAE3UI14_9BACT|nr:helix-turn-helix domain-containing protein [Xanthocytophaga agilis]MDJ1506653.1 helix-turn-helix domain-containing protein [Xanthocytophaga agilis]
MIYTKIQAPDYLKPYVRFFLIIESQEQISQPVRFNVFTDGYPGLIFQQEGIFSDNRMKPLPRLLLHGPITKYSEKTVKEKYNNLLVCLKPNALKTVFGIDAALLTDTYCDLNNMLKSSLTLSLFEARSVNEKITIVSHFLWMLATQNKHCQNRTVEYVMEALMNKNGIYSNGIYSIKECCSYVGISERSLERLMMENIGVSPKLFMRIQRFQSALSLINTNPFRSFTDICYQLNYADQSHQIREFKEFAGMTPKQFKLRDPQLILNFAD